MLHLNFRCPVVFAFLIILGACQSTSRYGAPTPGQLLGSLPIAGGGVGKAEISAYHPGSHRIFVVNPKDHRVDVIDASDPGALTVHGSLDLQQHFPGSPNSAAVSGDLLAVALEARNKQDAGVVLFFDAQSLQLVHKARAGALPDMVTFSPDGSMCLVANEGEPDDDCKRDPEGSVTIIRIPGWQVQQIDFRRFDPQHQALVQAGVRISNPNARVSQDLEPEYIAVSSDSRTAYVTLQENNALAVVDLAQAVVTQLLPLGHKDWQRSVMDASDKDGGVNMRRWPVQGLYQPDAIVSFRAAGREYLATANEGDSRAYDGQPGWCDEIRVSEVELDKAVFPKAKKLQKEAGLGRLKMSRVDGDLDGDGDYDQICSFGARSFSIWDCQGRLVYDSGDLLAQHAMQVKSQWFNSDCSDASWDSRSDDKGVEPDAIEMGMLDGKPHVFVGLERHGAVLVYDVSQPSAPRWVAYLLSTRDQSPEGLKFIAAKDSPNGRPLLLGSYENSGTVALFALDF